MNRLFKVILLFSTILLLLVPAFGAANPGPEKKSPLFAPVTTIIKSLAINRLTIVINLDELKSSGDKGGGNGDFLQYLKLLPTIQQGNIAGLRLILLSRVDKWKLILSNLSLNINDFRPGKSSRWQINGTYDLHHPALNTSGTISMEMILEPMKKKFTGRGTLKVTGRSGDHHYVLSMPINIKENLVLKPELLLDGHAPITSELRISLPDSDTHGWKAVCKGELADLAMIAAMLPGNKQLPGAARPKSGQFFYRLALKGRKAFFQPPYDLNLRLKAKKMQFQSANGEAAIEDAGFSLDAAMSVPQNGSGTLKMTTIIHGGPCLWHNYFWDLSGQDARGIFECRVSFRHGFPVLDAGIGFSGRIDATPLWAGSVVGSWSPDKTKIAITGQPMDIARTVKIVLPEFLDEQPPIIQGLKVGGHYQLSATVEKENHVIRVTAGNAAIHQGDIASKGYGQLRDLEALIPLAGLSWNDIRGEWKVDNQAKPLKLKFAAITGPYLQAGEQAVSFYWQGGNLFMPNKVKVVAMGCPLTISNATMYHPLQANRRRTELHLEVASASLNDPLPELPLSAKIIDLVNKVRRHLQGDLDLFFVGNQLNTRGKVQFSLFSGQIRIGNIQLRRLFSPSRVISLDMEARKLDLREVTSLIQAGSATGIIDISLKNFEISYGQPSRFDLEINSVHVPGVPRKISVEAIENLSLLSSGSSAGHGLLNVGINRFFSHYRYDKIGLYCRLRDDVFQLRGLIHRGGREYVVKRGLLGGVDIVNYNPDNQISFRDMQERILRIFNKK